MPWLKQLKNYALLMRLHRPAGIWLLLWPTLWALWIAGNGQPNVKNVMIFILGTVLMRSAGCIINDFADRHIDGAITRTKERPLITGSVSIKEAVYLFILLCSIAFVLVLFLNWLTIALAIVALLLAMSYPFMKRYIQTPQIILGIAFAWGIPMAFAAQSETVPLVAWLLFFATCLWIIAYDTQYALADREDDVKIGVKSTAILFGKADIATIICLQTLFLLLLSILGVWQGFGIFYYFGLVIAAVLFVYQSHLIKDRNPSQCIAAFTNNQWVGLIIFVGLLLV